MKLYNCPDCTHTEDTCENCTRYQVTTTFTNIPPACRNCPNHPSNGGSGNCNCTLGDWPVIC